MKNQHYVYKLQKYIKKGLGYMDEQFIEVLL